MRHLLYCQCIRACDRFQGGKQERVLERDNQKQFWWLNYDFARLRQDFSELFLTYRMEKAGTICSPAFDSTIGVLYIMLNQRKEVTMYHIKISAAAAASSTARVMAGG